MYSVLYDKVKNKKGQIKSECLLAINSLLRADNDRKVIITKKNGKITIRVE